MSVKKLEGSGVFEGGGGGGHVLNVLFDYYIILKSLIKQEISRKDFFVPRNSNSGCQRN